MARHLLSVALLTCGLIMALACAPARAPLQIIPLGAAPAQAQSGNTRVFTVAKFPVEAEARDAVAAKRKALNEGQAAAFRTLLRRLVPVTSYSQLLQLRDVKAGNYVSGFSVRSERNSRTAYLASLDFTFRARAVRQLLRSRAIPFLDEQAPPTTLIPVYMPPEAATGTSVPKALTQAEGSRTWFDMWADLDVTNAIAPLKVRRRISQVHPDTFRSLANGDMNALRILEAEYNTPAIMIALAQPDLATGRLNVTLAGRDGVGRFILQRGYRLQGDFVYTCELAAVVALGIIEGRWKATMVTTRGAGQAPAREDPVSRFVVTFSSPGQWEQVRTTIARLPGVSALDVAVSARSATVTLRYPGGINDLARALLEQRLYLRNVGTGWILNAG
ncbi:MAG: DUF2066 domain-containing protein [Pseudomonadota bacterium]